MKQSQTKRRKPRDRPGLNKWKAVSAALCGVMLAMVAIMWPREPETRNGWNKVYEAMGAYLVAAGVFFTSLIGGWDFLPGLLAFMMGMDYLSGILVGAFGRSKKSPHGGLSSRVGFIGMARKGLMLCVVMVAHQLDTGFQLEGNMLRNVICGCYIGVEGMSFIENLDLLGVPIPKPLLKIMRGLRDKGELPQTPTDTDLQD